MILRIFYPLLASLLTGVLSVLSFQLKPTPAKPTPDLLSKRERDVINEINLARTNPAQYVIFLEQLRSSYHDKVIHFPDGQMLVTNEGIAALDEALSFMRKLRPQQPFELRNGMILAAKVHLTDLTATGGFGHKGSDGSKPEDRLNRYGSWSDSVGEDIVYNSGTARNDVLGLIIDDGVANRGHRKNLFKSDFHVIGIAMGEPIANKRMCVITFAGGFTDNKSPAAQRY